MIQFNMFSLFSVAIILLVSSCVQVAVVAQNFTYDKTTCVPGPHVYDNPAPAPDWQSPELWYFQIPTTVNDEESNNAGMIMLEVHRSWAPYGADRLYALAMDNYYDCAAFYLVDKDFYVQWGIASEPTETQKWATNIPDDPVVSTVSNTIGMVSFAMATGPGSRTTQLYVNTGDNSRLDSDGFTPFAKVIQGMDIVMAMSESIPVPDQLTYGREGNTWILEQYPEIDIVKGFSPKIFLPTDVAQEVVSLTSSPTSTSTVTVEMTAAPKAAATTGSTPVPTTSSFAPIIVSTPAPTVSTPVPIVSTPAPIVSTPVPVVSMPSPTISPTVPAVSTPTPTVSTPIPIVSTPAPTVSTPVPVVSTPTPAVSTPAPVVSTPAPTVSTPAPTVSTPAPTVSTPAPTVSTPAPTISTPAPSTVSTPDPTSALTNCPLFCNNFQVSNVCFVPGCGGCNLCERPCEFGGLITCTLGDCRSEVCQACDVCTGPTTSITTTPAPTTTTVNVAVVTPTIATTQAPTTPTVNVAIVTDTVVDTVVDTTVVETTVVDTTGVDTTGFDTTVVDTVEEDSEEDVDDVGSLIILDGKTDDGFINDSNTTSDTIFKGNNLRADTVEVAATTISPTASPSTTSPPTTSLPVTTSPPLLVSSIESMTSAGTTVAVTTTIVILLSSLVAMYAL